MIRPDRDPRRIATSLEHLLGNLDAPSVDVLDVIFRDWASIVGPDLAQHTRPASVDGDRLVVNASDSAWANEFKWLEPQVLERLATVTESERITRVHVKVSRSS